MAERISGTARRIERRVILRHAEVAALMALVLSALVAAILDRPPPLEPLAALIMEWTPVPIANWLLEALGPAGKPLALYGASAVGLAVAGPLGLLAASRLPGRVGPLLAVAASVALAGLLMRPSGLPGLVTLISGFWAAFWALRWRARLAAGQRVELSVQTAATDAPTDGRRRALLIAAVNAGALAVASFVPVVASGLRMSVLGRTVRPPLLAYSPPGPRQPEFALPGLTPEITPLPSFYVMSKNVADPVLDAATWSLTVSGRVRRSLSLSLDELAAMARVDQHVTMQCVSNPVGGPLWSATLFSGVPLADVLARADLAPDAAWISFEGPDGHREQLPIGGASDPGVLLAYGMAGEWLSPQHGFPVRLLVPGLYGFRSVKWLTRMDVLAEARPGHWEERGWSAAEIHTTARVDLVQRTASGALAAGVAFTGRRGVSAVEVRVDGGPWQPAALHTPTLGPVMWVQWRATLDAPAGREIRVEVRAIDGNGAAQDETQRGQFPSGASGLHGLTVRL